MPKRIFEELLNYMEEEDIFDGVSQGDISSKEWDSFVESLSRDKGILWEETVK